MAVTALRPAAGPTRRQLQLGLAVLWLLDGALQLQPFMLGSGFAHQVIAPAGQGQPGFVAAAVAWAARLIGAHPALWDSLFAAVQLLIGAGLLWRRSARAALAASVAWAAGVWYLGEGLGGIASGHASLLTGAPGAVAVYAVVALVAWASPALPVDASRAAVGSWVTTDDAGGPPRRWAPVAWAVIWVGDAVFRLLPGQDRAAQMASTISGNASGAPGWLAGLDHSAAAAVAHAGYPIVVGTFAVEVAIGLLALTGRVGRTAAAVGGIAFLVLVWLVGQSLGQIYSGQATDPNTAAPLALLAVALLAGDGRPAGRAAYPTPSEVAVAEGRAA